MIMADALEVLEDSGACILGRRDFLSIKSVLELLEILKFLLLLRHQNVVRCNGSSMLRLDLIDLEKNARDRLGVDLAPDRDRLGLCDGMLALINDLLVALGLRVEAMLERNLLHLLMRRNFLVASPHDVLRSGRRRATPAVTRLWLATRSTAIGAHWSILLAAVRVGLGRGVRTRRPGNI